MEGWNECNFLGSRLETTYGISTFSQIHILFLFALSGTARRNCSGTNSATPGRASGLFRSVNGATVGVRKTCTPASYRALDTYPLRTCTELKKGDHANQSTVDLDPVSERMNQTGRDGIGWTDRKDSTTWSVVTARLAGGRTGYFGHTKLMANQASSAPHRRYWSAVAPWWGDSGSCIGCFGVGSSGKSWFWTCGPAAYGRPLIHRVHAAVRVCLWPCVGTRLEQNVL